MSINCELKEMPVQPVLSIRTNTSLENLPQTIGESYGKVMAYLGQNGLKCTGAPFTAYYNLDMSDLDVEMGFPVANKTEGNADIKSSEIPAGKYVTYLYTGPYSEMGPVYEGMNKWIAEKGYETTMPCYEIYFNSPADTPQDKLQTQILLAIK